MSISSMALSGMNAASSFMESAARRIASPVTGELEREASAKVTTAQGRVLSADSFASTNVTSPVEDMVALLKSKNAFLANLSVFKTADAMAGSLLHIAK